MSREGLVVMTEIERECRESWQMRIELGAQSQARMSLFQAVVECEVSGMDADEVQAAFEYSFNEIWQTGGFQHRKAG
jgi:hypothetical protein